MNIRRTALLVTALLAPLPMSACLSLDTSPAELETTSRTVVVTPNRSIQAAIDAALPGTTIVVMPGVYRETASADNALQVTKSGIRLVGAGGPGNPVVLENAGPQRNGLAVTPEPQCSECHSNNGRSGDLLPAAHAPGAHDDFIKGFELRGFTVTGFENGVFTRHLEDFRITNNQALGNGGYGIFPTLSKRGLVANNRVTGANDSGIWVETSRDVTVRGNLLTDNVMGIEVSNSTDILITNNTAQGNSAGIAILQLPFLKRLETRRVTVRNNTVTDNNRPNSAEPFTIAALVPEGTGIFVLAASDSLIANNRVSGNNLAGIGIADYCLAVMGSDFSCENVPPDSDPDPTGNRVLGNHVMGNGLNPTPSPFAAVAADLVHLVLPGGGEGNCFSRNRYDTAFPEPLPECASPGRGH